MTIWGIITHKDNNYLTNQQKKKEKELLVLFVMVELMGDTIYLRPKKTQKPNQNQTKTK